LHVFTGSGNSSGCKKNLDLESERKIWNQDGRLLVPKENVDIMWNTSMVQMGNSEPCQHCYPMYIKSVTLKSFFSVKYPEFVEDEHKQFCQSLQLFSTTPTYINPHVKLTFHRMWDSWTSDYEKYYILRSDPKGGRSTFLWKVCELLPDYMASILEYSTLQLTFQLLVQCSSEILVGPNPTQDV
jgi:hypothetical protein